MLSRSTHGVKATEKTVTQDERSPPKVHTPGDENGKPDDSVLPELPKLTQRTRNRTPILMIVTSSNFFLRSIKIGWCYC